MFLRSHLTAQQYHSSLAHAQGIQPILSAKTYLKSAYKTRRIFKLRASQHVHGMMTCFAFGDDLVCSHNLPFLSGIADGSVPDAALERVLDRRGARQKILWYHGVRVDLCQSFCRLSGDCGAS